MIARTSARARTENWHGTENGYVNRGCRCDECREGLNAARRSRDPFRGQPARPWTDDDLGLLAEYSGHPIQELCQVLERSQQAIRRKKQDIAAGGGIAECYWTPDEDAFILATPHLTSRQVAVHLGRTFSSVKNRRRIFTAVKGATFDGYSKSPTHIAGRPLLCKSCTGCGRLLSAKWFSFDIKRRKWTPKCIRCKVPSRHVPDPATASAHSRTHRAKARAMTIDKAVRSGQPYLDSDHIILRDPDMTLMEKAVTLGRTWAAISGACHRNGYPSRVGLGDPERDQWHIHNPNQDMAA